MRKWKQNLPEFSVSAYNTNLNVFARDLPFKSAQIYETQHITKENEMQHHK